MNINEDITEWIELADQDLGAAKLIYLHIPDYKETISFHCQQAVEKYLKAFLINLELEFKPKHDLGYLLDLISTKDNSLDAYYLSALSLNEFAVKIRYPEKIDKPTDEEMREAISIAEKFREIITNKLNIK